VVLSGDELGSLAVKLVAPLTSMGPKKVGKVWLVPIEATAANGLERDSVADVLQLRGVSLSRFRSRIGRLSDDDLAERAPTAGSGFGPTAFAQRGLSG
jgi:mRNA-degrading endonuclease toxin of MazEF toxin-antitoxin module